MDLFRCVTMLIDMGRCMGMLVPPAAGQTIDRSKLVDLTSGIGGPARIIAVLP